jgi:hypothetical protein
MKMGEEQVIAGSGNVFADIDIPNQEKSMLLIIEEMKDQLTIYKERDTWLYEYLTEEKLRFEGELSESGKGNPLPENISNDDLVARCYIDAYSLLLYNLWSNKHDTD